MRQKIETGEFYHIYNRGVDKRIVYSNRHEATRFLESMREFNVTEPIGSIYQNHQNRRGPTPTTEDRLVNVLAYCLNPNHFHFILQQLAEGGVSEFMKRLGGGYTCYFNDKHSRSGSLFEGKYKYKHVDSDEYLRYLSVYVNLNNEVHRRGPTATTKKALSSYGQYIGTELKEPLYFVENKDAILSYFENPAEYKKYAEETLLEIVKNKEKYREIGLW